MRHWLVCVCLLTCGAAAAETCKYIDADGRTIYSNIPIKRARKVSCFQPPVPADAPDPGSAANAKAVSPVGAAGRPHVDASTQRQRDSSRRQILEDELAREQEALAAAKKALEQQSPAAGGGRTDAGADERSKSYSEAVALHEKNIASLRQELANLK